MPTPAVGIFKIKRKSLRPILRARVVRCSDGQPVDFTGAIGVRVQMADEDGVPKIVDGMASFPFGPEAGILQYVWGSPDTLVLGCYSLEFDVDYGGTDVHTFPEDGVINVVVEADVNDAV